uniref:Uncharacterized protein n=1 Tax=Arion vulgaris TaxID=1028688 RepID=A0A0B6ZCB3_9EUPU
MESYRETRCNKVSPSPVDGSKGRIVPQFFARCQFFVQDPHSHMTILYPIQVTLLFLAVLAKTSVLVIPAYFNTLIFFVAPGDP